MDSPALNYLAKSGSGSDFMCCIRSDSVACFFASVVKQTDSY